MNLSDGGFLYDPDSEYAKYVNSDVKPFDAIAHIPCLALLGEPGIGKSITMEALRNSVQQNLQGDETLLYLNLNEYGDESRLIQDVFGSSEFITWADGSHVLHLFLDSLDECRIQIPKVGTVIKNRLREHRNSLPRLRLRIACRTADWPGVLDDSLPDMWGKESYGAFELAPLRRQDVATVAEANGIDAAVFLEEIHRTETSALANRPITLKFLLANFSNNGSLPGSRRELYEEGCLRLCDEQNPDRVDSSTGVTTARHRLMVASRIAAVSLFCRKPVLLVGPRPAQVEEDEVNIQDLVGGTEPSENGGAVEVTTTALQEALATGIFNSRGPGRMGFGHQTYAEFLAARYLATHQFDAATILSLLRHPDDRDGHIVPQLYEVAGWAASVDAEVLTAIASRDLKVLLRCDESSLDDDRRRIIISELLQALQDGRDNDREWDLHRKYAKLAHPDLAEQLLPWIVDTNKGDTARETAIEIAKVCGVRDVQAALVDIVLNPSEVLRVRDAAAYALCDIADTDTRKRLVPAAKDEIGNDPQDQLKGNALQSLWPGLISAEELFRCLTPPKQENFGGAYSYFLGYEMAGHLKPDDLSHALKWLSKLIAENRLSYSMYKAADEITVKAWQNMTVRDVLDALADVSIQCFRKYQGLVHDTDTLKEHAHVFDDPGNRHTLAAAIVGKSQDQHTRYELTGRSPQLVRQEDFEWCIEQLVASVGSPPESLWAGLAWSWFCCGEPESVRLDAILRARALSPCLEQESSRLCEPVDLASQRAAQLRTQHAQMLARERPRAPEPLEWSPKDRIDHWLTNSEHGEAKAFWVLIRDMTLEETSSEYGLIPSDIRKLPGWQNADALTRQRILRAAEGSGIGERTDIQVTAVVPGLRPNTTDTVRAIIEAKGCWNTGLRSAMKDQLVDRYLQDNDCRHGIYLVGWYRCDQWNGRLGQKSATPGWSLDDARRFFEDQAQEMPADIKIRAFVLDARLR